MSPLVVALLGTDHHPFDRLVDWMDVLVTDQPDLTAVVQYGHSAAPVVAAGRPFFTHAELRELVTRADVVVCHGGPGTIMDARSGGHVPVCVPRDPERGEHVDGHQQRFAEVAEGAGYVRRVGSCDDLLRAVAATLGRDGAPAGPPAAPADVAVDPDAVARDAAARFALQVDPVVGTRVRRSRSVRRTLLSRVAR